jgi:acyl-CoA synthetase (AMP-forming)/AMP-acid ligase II
MPYTSPYGPIPPVPDCNIYQAFWNRPDIAEWPTKGNHTLWIDAATGQKRTYNAFRRRVEDTMTALGGPVSSGGFGLEYKHAGGGLGEGEIVAIVSENDMEYPVLVHALMGLAIPYVLISAYSTSFELAHAMRVSGCSRVFVSALTEGGALLERVVGVAKTVGIGGSRVYCLSGDVKGRLSLADMIGRVRASKGSCLVC